MKPEDSLRNRRLSKLKWNRKNKDKVREAYRKYYYAHPDRVLKKIKRNKERYWEKKLLSSIDI